VRLVQMGKYKHRWRRWREHATFDVWAYLAVVDKTLRQSEALRTQHHAQLVLLTHTVLRP